MGSKDRKYCKAYFLAEKYSCTTNTINKNIDGKLTDGDKNLKNQLALYGNVYANILANSGGNQDYTIDGKVEDRQFEA